MRPRTLIVNRADAGRDLAAWLRVRLGLPGRDVQRLIRRGVVHVGGKPCADPARRLKSGQKVDLRPGEVNVSRSPTASAKRKSGLAPSIIRFVDAHVVVVNKPAGLTTMRHADEAAEFGPRGKRFLPNTLADQLPALLDQSRARSKRNAPPTPNAPPPSSRVIAVHRLDKDTSGLVVFARTPEAARKLDAQFRQHSTERLYRAVVRGQAVDARIETHLVRDRGDGRRGSGKDSDEGQRAVTHVRVLERLGDFTLVECRLETGRTHQVRIHLGEAGTPLCGERVYDRPLHGRPAPDGSGMTRIALHAMSLAFDHPATGERMQFQAPLPEDMVELLNRLRRREPRQPAPEESSP